MEDSLPTIILASLLGLFFVYKNYLAITRDVPPEYLSQQSVVDSIRNPGESAIYKSTKLDYSSGLRVGLAIRFNHYKIRNGNLNDMWEILMYALETNPCKSVRFDGSAIELAKVNAWAQNVANFLREQQIKVLALPLSCFIASPQVFILVVACFLAQTTVHVFDEKTDHGEDWVAEVTNGNVLLKTESTSVSLGSFEAEPSASFKYTYTPDKDRGIALVVTTKLGPNITSTSRFTQINLVAATASCLKHLPPEHALSEKDRMLVIQDERSTEAITNTITKVLASFVSHADLYLSNSIAQGLEWSPTIISASQKSAMSLYKEPQGLGKIIYWHRQFALTQLKFSKGTFFKPYHSLRLLFAYKSINDGPLESWNKVRAALSTHVVEELGYINIAGPFLVTDIHDYRKIQSPMASSSLVFRGSIAQADEAKLDDYDGFRPGNICVRGHNIGKTYTTMKSAGDKHITPDSEGFHRISKVKGNWGSDGCLYVYS
ncbi:hypothetical protein FDK38_001805 [Candidozyma auris]|nr:hypothetical protein FDK38_001805 [[Candida] auris]